MNPVVENGIEVEFRSDDTMNISYLSKIIEINGLLF